LGGAVLGGAASGGFGVATEAGGDAAAAGSAGISSPTLPALPARLPACPQGRPTLSAVVLNRNGAAHLQRLFASLAAHNTYPLHDILVIDHASTDASAEVVRTWSDRLPLRLVACRCNHSFSWSNNRAAERAGGDYLLLLNNDVVFEGDVLGRLVACAQAADGIVGIAQKRWRPETGARGWYHAGARFVWDPRARGLRPREAVPAAGDPGRWTGAAAMPFTTASVLVVERARFLALGGFWEGYVYGYEDVDLGLRASLGHGVPVATVNDVWALHDEGGTRRRLPTRARRQRRTANWRELQTRMGFPLWRWWRRAALADPLAMLGRALPVRTGGPGLTERAQALWAEGAKALWAEGAKALRVDLGRAAGTADGGVGLDVVGGGEVLCLTDPRQRAFRAAARGPRLATVALADAGALDAWCRHPDLAACDLVLAGTPEAAARLAAAGAPATQVAAWAERGAAGLTAGGDGAAGGALAALLRRHEAALPARVALVSAAPGAAGLWRELRRSLAAAGLASRVLGPGRADLWTWADLVVPLPDLTARTGLPAERPWVAPTPQATLADRLLTRERAASRPPADPPLPDLRGAAFPDA
jgi:GT2 family glycosyltransferase